MLRQGVNVLPARRRAETRPLTADAPRAEPRAQLLLTADDPRADLLPQQQADRPADWRRAGLRARRQPPATQHDAQHPRPLDTPHRRQPPRRGTTRLPCPLPSPRQHCIRLPSPHPNHRQIPDLWSQMTTPGPPTTSRRTQQRHQRLTPLAPTARIDRPRPRSRLFLLLRSPPKLHTAPPVQGEGALPSELQLGTTLTEGLHVSTLGSASSPYLSSIDAVHATGDDQDVDAAPAKRRKRDPKPTLPDLDPSQPNLHRWFPTREPGPAASPRAADEHTEHEPADLPDR